MPGLKVEMKYKSRRVRLPGGFSVAIMVFSHAFVPRFQPGTKDTEKNGRLRGLGHANVHFFRVL